MSSREPGAGMVPVVRAELVTRDMEVIAELISHLWTERRARFRCEDPARVSASVRSAVAGGLSAGLVRFGGFDYDAEISSGNGPYAAAVLQGAGMITAPREHLRFTRGGAFMLPAGSPCATTMRDAGYALIQVPWPVAAALAAETAGLPAAGLRFESIAPVSSARRALWSGTAAYLCHELVSSATAEISPLMAAEMTRLAAAAMLETFPNTAMTTPYLPGPGRAPPAAVRRAAAFIDAHAGQPITLADIAAAAGVTGRALQYAFRRHYDTTPTGYLRQVRLEHAHRDLLAAAPADGTTVAAIARTWGWASPAGFTAAYRRRYGQPPGQTLRT